MNDKNRIMLVSDETLVIQDLKEEGNGKINCLYDGAKVSNSSLGNYVVVGEDSYVNKCFFEDYVKLNRRNFVEDTKIGTCTYTGMNTVIKHADIGKYCSISWNVSITGNKHNYNFVSAHPLTNFKSFGFVEENQPLDFERIIIGNDVWIGMNVCILPGSKIGDGAVIGAGSVVTKNVPDYAIVAGNPARIIKYRFSEEIINILKQIKWWNLNRFVITKNIELFQSEFNIETAKKILAIKRRLLKIKGSKL